MARRRRQSGLEDMLDVAAMLPWRLALVLAVVLFFGLHYWATRTETPPKDVAALGAYAGRQLYRTLAMFLQYLIPGILVIGAIISNIKARQQAKRYAAAQELGAHAALTDITWQEFEGLVGEHFRRQGYQVKAIGGDGLDGGVDLELNKGTERLLVQCKQWRALKVGVDVVRELYGVMAARGATGAFVVTSGAFTTEAKAFCQGRNISVIDGAQLVASMHNGKWVARAEGWIAPDVTTHATTPNCPKCNAAMVKRVAKQGPRAGESFWGCSRYPKCTGIRATQ